MDTTRRDFLRNSALAATAVAASSKITGSAEAATAMATATAPKNYALPPTKRRGGMLYRQLGSTGDEVSLVGLGGFHIGKQKEESESLRIIHAALDGGITFMDNCWDYNDGTSEVRMGKALRGRRDKVFLMSKIDGRTKEAAARQIDESLLRLETDRIDLMQFHEVIRLEDPDRIFAKGGAFEAMMAAKKAGKIRHIGFTGHKDPLVHNRMLDVAAEHGFKFDAVQMPINVMDAHFRSFARNVLPRLVSQKTGVLAMKTFGDHFILDHVVKSGTATPIQLLHYSMSQPVSTVITGIDSLKFLHQALEAARTFVPLTSAQKVALLDKMRLASADGSLEKFKTSPRYDGTAKNPDWLG
ncbi:putative oxidoreductase [Abditibacterium utsteinense]|uniref:Putative oxidoreductase n=1 Tax=Abditibacterium utsteinense TaxID=1960156 RepID=A0A2S8STW7_9BACT|nr:aldo/keto reductase [Abditibacterium utsteinense]PQV64189.1 putative oxidoreductase [Abditibacterium utsteinense]